MLLVLLMGCGSPEVGGGPSFERGARRSAPVEHDAGPITSAPLSADVEITDLPSPESDRVHVTGILGIEKFDQDGDRKVWVRRAAGDLTTELVVAERISDVWVAEVRLYGSSMPDRPAISGDGAWVAFVSGISGIASIWLVPFDGGVDPVQLTNVGLHLEKRAPGLPPVGFLPPPIDESLHFQGSDLVWNGPSGPQTVRWQ